MPSFEDALDAMWDAILKDMSDGIVPRTTSSFAELHDYVDANMYLVNAFPELMDHPEDELEMFNAASSIIDDKLRESRR